MTTRSDEELTPSEWRDLVGLLGGMETVRALLSRKMRVEMPGRILPIRRDFAPGSFFGDSNWTELLSEADVRAASMKSLDGLKIKFQHCVELMDEGFITGEEKLNRLRRSGVVLLGADAFWTLWKEPGHKTLNRLYAAQGVTYLDFFGSIFRSPVGSRCILNLSRGDGGRWKNDSRSLGLNWGPKLLTAVTEESCPATA